MVINGNEGTWYYVETIESIINILVSFGLPCALCMYINPIFRSIEPHLHHFPLESERGVLEVRNTNTFFMRKRVSNIHLGKFSFTKQNFQVGNTSMFQNSTFHSFQHFSLWLERHLSKVEKYFFIELLMTSTNPFSIALAFSSKLRKLNSFWI